MILMNKFLLKFSNEVEFALNSSRKGEIKAKSRYSQKHREDKLL